MSSEQQLVVCGLSDVPLAVQSFNANALISVLHPDLMPETPASVPSGNHFRLAIDDIEAPHTGLKHASLEDVEALCHFAERWHRSVLVARRTGDVGRSLVVHCFAGISRSTAAAYAIMCALNPDQSERKLAQYLRNASPAASPNRLIVELADRALRRNGRMIKAIKAIGAGSASARLGLFTLASNLQDVRHAA